MAYSHHVNRFEPSAEEDGPTIEEQIERFEEQIGQRVSAETKAMAQFRAAMIAQGLDPDAKPELSPELAAKIADDAMLSDRDIFFGDTNREFMGQKIKAKDDDFG